MANDKPNVLVIMGDDIGITNLSCYGMGVMGYQTPNIDRIAKEGVLFTDFYAEQSCTAGRAAFVTGMTPVRSGLTKVGIPGSQLGIKEGTPTIAHAFKDLGYRTGQFGKNHLGDRDEHLPTAHGFDEFFGVLYHLNAMQQPEDPDFPTREESPEMWDNFAPRGVIHSWAGGDIVDTGQMTTRRMIDADDEFGSAAMRFMRDAVAADEPFFVWHNTTHMHYVTHPKPANAGQAGRWQSPYHDTMVDHDRNVGEMLDLLDELGIAENTIVVYTTDNGAHVNYWPDGATTPFRSEKNTNWEGAYRVPCVARWPRHFREGEILNGIFSLQDWMPTLVAAAGDETLSQRLLDGTEMNGHKMKQHLDGFNQMDYLTGKTDTSARNSFAYFADTGECCAFRFENWKSVFMEQQTRGTYEVWVHPFEHLRVPKLFNLRTDPFERADITSNVFWNWQNEKQYILLPINAMIAKQAQSLIDYPPIQIPASYNLDTIQKQIEDAMAAN